jgi:hypothetical protein
VAYPAEAGPRAEMLFRALGQEFEPAPTNEDGRPASGVPQQVSSPPVSGAPTSGGPGAPWALHAGPLPTVPPEPVSPSAPSVPAPPTVPSPTAAPVTSVPPADSTVHLPVIQSVPPAPAAPAAPDPFDTSGGRRITPVERPPRNRTGLWIGAVILAAVLAGGAGFLAGGALGDDEPTSPAASAAPPLYEATQHSLNKAKFDADFMPIAEPWLPEVGGCAIDTEVGGPKLPEGEKRHVFCRYLSLSVHFALYESPDKKNAARAYRQEMGVVNRALAPGLREASQATGGVSKAPGNYVEYAGNGHDGRPVCGIWWDRDDSMTAVYFETPCAAGIAGNWDALRDVWQRTS